MKTSRAISIWCQNQNAPVIAREDRLQIALPDNVLFFARRGELRDQDQLVLHSLANVLRRVPYTILVEGHTDNLPLGPGSRYVSNWELSLARAMAVVRYLIQYEGLSPRSVWVSRLSANSIHAIRMIRRNTGPPIGASRSACSAMSDPDDVYVALIQSPLR